MVETLLTTREVAALLRCSRVTVWKLVRDGEIPAVRFGEHGHLRFVQTDVLALISRGRRKTDALAAA